MKKFLCASFLLLSGVAQAVPYVSKTDHFTADFPGPVTTRTVKEMHSYGWGTSRVVCGVIVFNGKERMSRYDILKNIKADSSMKFNLKEIKFGQVPGLEFDGVDEHGVPVFGRTFSTKHSSYMVVSSNFDTAASRKFVESFHFIEPAPAKGAKKKK